MVFVAGTPPVPKVSNTVTVFLGSFETSLAQRVICVCQRKHIWLPLARGLNSVIFSLFVSSLSGSADLARHNEWFLKGHFRHMLGLLFFVAKKGLFGPKKALKGVITGKVVQWALPMK